MCLPSTTTGKLLSSLLRFICTVCFRRIFSNNNWQRGDEFWDTQPWTVHDSYSKVNGFVEYINQAGTRLQKFQRELIFGNFAALHRPLWSVISWAVLGRVSFLAVNMVKPPASPLPLVKPLPRPKIKIIVHRFNDSFIYNANKLRIRGSMLIFIQL